MTDLPEWIERLRPTDLPGTYVYEADEIRKVFQALSIAWDALDRYKNMRSDMEIPNRHLGAAGAMYDIEEIGK